MKSVLNNNTISTSNSSMKRNRTILTAYSNRKKLEIKTAEPISIKKITNIADVIDIDPNTKNTNKKKAYLWDIDEVLLTLPQTAGTDGWFYESLSSQTEEHGDKEVALKNTREDYIKIHERTAVVPVEPDTAVVVAATQSMGICLAVTSRDNDDRLKAATVRQLNDIKISFNQGTLKNLRLELETKTSNNPTNAGLENGVLYCNGHDKGLCIEILKKTLNLKIDEIIDVDDKEKYLMQMHAMAQRNEIEFTGFHYTRLAHKQQIDPNIAKVQMAVLNKMNGILPDEWALAIVKHENEVKLRSDSFSSVMLSPQSNSANNSPMHKRSPSNELSGNEPKKTKLTVHNEKFTRKINFDANEDSAQESGQQKKFKSRITLKHI